MKKFFFFMNAYTQGKSGADVLCSELVKKLPQTTQKIVVTSLPGKKLFEEMHNTSFFTTSREHQFNNVFITYIQRTIQAFSLWSTIQKNDTLIASSDFFPDVIPAFFLKKSGVRWIQIIHHLYPHFLKRKGNILVNVMAYYLQKISFFLIKKRFDIIVVINPFVKKQLIGQGFNQKKLSVIPNGIDISHIKKIKRNKISFDGVFVGRFHQSKGIFDVMQIWNRVAEKIPSARLAIIGTGDAKIKKILTEQLQKNNMTNNVTIIENADDNELFSILKSSKTLLFPSHEEGFGRVIAEAMVCGISVICWNLPVYKTVFGGNYISAPFGNIGAFATITAKLLEDKKMRENVAKKAEKFVEKYDWKYILPKYIKLLSL